MNYGAAGEIKSRNSAAQKCIEQSALPPYHVGHREVDDQLHRTMNRIMALNFMRSAKAPVIRAGVMMANISW